MAIIYTQTDNVGSVVSTWCSGATVNASIPTRTAEAGGTPGTGTPSVTTAASAVSEADLNFEITPAGGVTWGAGTWTARFDVTTANMNVTWDAVYICQTDSSHTNKATIGSATGLAQSMGSTGTKSTTVSGSAVTPAGGDLVEVLFLFSNSAMSNSSWNIKPDLNIDSPFTAGSTFIAKSVIVSQAAKRAAFW